MTADGRPLELRVVFLPATARDAELTRSVLSGAGITCVCCTGIEAACLELDGGGGVLLLPEEAVAAEGRARLAAWLAGQPPWSDLPVLVLARPGADSAALAQAVDQLGNVTVLERPIRLAALVSAVRSALRARQRQHQIRDHLTARARVEAAMRDADRRKDEFLAILAHELRNPLAPVRNLLPVLRLLGGADGESRRVAEMLERQVTHLVRLVDDLMEVSRITRGKIELRKECVELASVVRGAVETSLPLIEAAGVNLSVSLHEGPMVVDGDPVRLTQVFANLMNNAAKFTGRGGHIWVTGVCEGGWAEVSVRDDGCGIPADMLPRVFDLFTQAGEPGRSHGGLGIGLALVRRLVQMHGGQVAAASAGPGAGSELLVRLPLAAAGANAAAPRPACVRPLGPGRVLVVDDHHDAADSLGMLLRQRGAEVRVEYGGPAALRAIEEYRPAVALLDIGMPGMDGYELAQRIRALPSGSDMTLIALTGWGQEDDRRRTKEVGFDHHLIKPADIEALERLLSAPPGRPG